MIDKIREFLLAFGHFNIDYLSGKVNGMTVYQDSFEPVVKEYAGGGRLLRYGFCVELTSPYAIDLNQESHMIVDEFLEFIERKNKLRQLPLLDEGTAQKINIVENTGRLKATPNRADFKVRLELLYTKE